MPTKFIQDCWKDFQAKKNLSYVCNPSIPILWFGNYDEYLNSKVKIVTIGLNPSSMEFKKNKSSKSYEIKLRFPAACSIDNKKVLSQQDLNTYKKAMNEYFSTKNDYWDWFKYNERIIAALGASYKVPTVANRAIHIDIYSSIATSPTWGKLQKCQKNQQLQNTSYNFNQFLCFLNPDIIVVSANASIVASTFKNASGNPCTKANMVGCIPKYEKSAYGPYIRGYHLAQNRKLIWVKNCRGKPLQVLNDIDVVTGIKAVYAKL